MKLLLLWERLPAPAQIVIGFPVLTALLFLFHLGPLSQPPVRAIFYGVFWAIPGTALLVIATQNEARKRRGPPQQHP